MTPQDRQLKKKQALRFYGEMIAKLREELTTVLVRIDREYYRLERNGQVVAVEETVEEVEAGK